MFDPYFATMPPTYARNTFWVCIAVLGALMGFGIGNGIETASSLLATSDGKTISPDAHAIVMDLPKSGCMLSARLARTGGTYTVSIGNTGSEVCRNVTYTVYYAAEERFIAASPKPKAGDYYWAAGNIEPGNAYQGATIQVEGEGDGTELCATADNADDSCVTRDDAGFGDSVISSEPAEDRSTNAGWLSMAGEGKEYGIWLWRSAYDLEPGESEAIISRAKEARFNAIYITADDYANNPARFDKDLYLEKLSLFVVAARNAGIAVDLVGGSPDWIKPENREKGYALIELADEFNRRYESRVRGVQYDVEPYLLPEYETGKEHVLGEFIDFVERSVAKLPDQPLGFDVVIPHFYDSTQKWTPKIRYGGRNEYTFTHLLHILDKRKNSRIIIMAYRNFVEGSNGSWTLAKSEIEEATGGNYLTRILVAQETGNIQPSYVTFYEVPKKSLFSSLERISWHFRAEKSFGGFAIHHMESFLRLKD
jgi:hypothetical protein